VSSWLYPTSAAGAMFQVANAMEGVGDLIENDHDDHYDRIIILERARRCLHGAMRFLEQSAGMHRTKLHMEWPAGEQTDEILHLHQLMSKQGGAS
jgi:hypothetical protein